jgi:N utilization substance protein B
MSRKKARELAMCLAFEKECQKDKTCEAIYDYLFEELSGDLFLPGEIKTPDEAYIKSTFSGTFGHLEQIDGLISSAAVGWAYSRISKISKAILRIAVYELLYAKDVPVAIAINEAVELSKKYDDPDAYTFVNGVLGAIVKNNN